MSEPRNDENRALILAPFGRDGLVAAGILAETGHRARPCVTLDDLVAELKAGAGCIVITQEAIQSADLSPLFVWLGGQPPWSDLPIIIITEHGGGPESNPRALRLMEALGNVTFLERPFRPLTFLSVVKSALRSRGRQLQAREHMAELSAREAALQDSETRFRTLADNIPVLTWTADAEGGISWYNSRWYEYTGTAPEEMEGWGWQSVHSPESLPLVLDKWRASIQSGEAFEMVFPLLGADGVFRPFLTRVVPVREGARSIRWFGSSVDISGERKSEAAIRASEEKLRLLNETLEQQVFERTALLRANEARLRTIFETSYQSQGLLEVDGTLLEANSTSLALIGAKLNEVVGRKFWETPWFSQTSGMSATVQAAIDEAAAGQSFRKQISINVIGGFRTLDFSLRPVRDESGKIVALLPEAADITDKLQAEEALRQAQKMEAVGQLTGGIAHDFNNMLQAIASGIELMHRRINAGRAEEAERYVDAAKQSLGRAAALVHRLLAFSRRQSLAPRRVDLDDLVSGMTAMIRQTVGPAIKVRVRMRDGCWPVKCDPNQLESALLNLAINARDAMGSLGGDLIIETEQVVLGPGDVAGAPGAEPGDFVRVSLSDTGSGMSADVLEHVFEPFFTTKPAGQGTGLGLSQVFGFISQSNGIVRIESEIGKGTSVHLFLPRSLAPQEGNANAEVVPDDRLTPKSATVLLVEDEADIRQLGAEALRDVGCVVLEAQDGPSGLNALRDALRGNARNVDILVTDVGLPGGLNGRQLADAARAILPNLPVLLITGYAGDALSTGIQEDAEMELLRKPFALDALAARVQAMLGSPSEEA